MDILNVIYKFIMRRQVIGTIITLGVAWVIVQLFNKLISRLLISGKDDFEVKRALAYFYSGKEEEKLLLD